MSRVSYEPPKPWPINKILVMEMGGQITFPKVQRDFVWTRNQMQLFIDSILKGYDIPKIYVREKKGKSGTYDVYDGHQRILTVVNFVANQFALKKGNKLKIRKLSLPPIDAIFEEVVDTKRSYVLMSLLNTKIKTLVNNDLIEAVV